jgi:hypothetical protein
LGQFWLEGEKRYPSMKKRKKEQKKKKKKKKREEKQEERPAENVNVIPSI